MHCIVSVCSRHAAKLLKFLCGDSQVREMVKVYDGIPLLLRYTALSMIHLLPSLQQPSQLIA